MGKKQPPELIFVVVGKGFLGIPSAFFLGFDHFRKSSCFYQSYFRTFYRKQKNTMMFY